MKKLMAYAVTAIALGFVVSTYAKKVTFDTSRLPNAEVRIIGVGETFTIPARGRKQQTFDLEKKTEKSKFLRKTKFEGYVKDIEVGTLKASDVKGLIEYINGIINEFNKPALIISQPQGSTGLSVSSAIKKVVFDIKEIESNGNDSIESATIYLRDPNKPGRIQHNYPYKNSRSIPLTLTNENIDEFTLWVDVIDPYGRKKRGNQPTKDSQIKKINEWINEYSIVKSSEKPFTIEVSSSITSGDYRGERVKLTFQEKINNESI